MSNINKRTTNEQLFNELTPEEGAGINGGQGESPIAKKVVKIARDVADLITQAPDREKTNRTNSIVTGRTDSSEADKSKNESRRNHQPWDENNYTSSDTGLYSILLNLPF